MNQPKKQSKKRLAFWGLSGLFIFGGCSVVAGIAQQSFEEQADKARESEAKTYVGSILRGQQAHRLESEQFTDNLQQLGIGIPEETDNYSYTIALPDPSGQTAIVTAMAKLPELRSFTGAAYATIDAQGKFIITVTGTCIGDIPKQTPPPAPELTQTGDQFDVVCAAESRVAE
ncbi:MAG: type IV pilin-like G/H family protein [Nodosilinea sp.]